MLANQLPRLCYWRADLANGEMVETVHYTKHHLNMCSLISQDDLDTLCDIANTHLIKTGGVCNKMGEIIPSTEKITLK